VVSVRLRESMEKAMATKGEARPKLRMRSLRLHVGCSLILKAIDKPCLNPFFGDCEHAELFLSI
jgi:hypothetical protein